MSNFLTIGEPLVVFASQDVDKELMDAVNFKKFLAGAELNVAVGVSRLGHNAIYISEVGKDIFGDFILKEIKKANIKTDYIKENSNYLTGFYFKQKVSNADPKVSYFRKNSAASNYSKGNIDEIDFNNIDFAHISGIMAAISNKALESVEYLIDILNKKNIPLTFDPNLRPVLWENEKIMIETLNRLSKKADILLPGIKEAKILTGLSDLEEICDYYLNNSEKTKIVIIKNGSNGAYVKEKGKKSFEVKAFKVDKVIDTVGAGDGFAVGVITGLMENLELSKAVKRGCAIGALAVQTSGDNDGYPTVEKLKEFLKGN